MIYIFYSWGIPTGNNRKPKGRANEGTQFREIARFGNTLFGTFIHAFAGRVVCCAIFKKKKKKPLVADKTTFIYCTTFVLIKSFYVRRWLDHCCMISKKLWNKECNGNYTFSSPSSFVYPNIFKSYTCIRVHTCIIGRV